MLNSFELQNAHFENKNPKTVRGLAKAIGPVYDSATVHFVLNTNDRFQLDKLADTGQILALKTSDNYTVYPVFQFTGNAVDKQIKELLKQFANVVNTPWWTIAAWLNIEREELNGLTPVEWIRQGNDFEVVNDLVAKAVVRWNQ